MLIMTIRPIFLYYIALVGFFGLFVLLMLWHTLLSPSTRLPVALILLLTVTPLLLPMRGFLDRKLKSCAWLAYISLLYFIHGSAEAYMGEENLFYVGLEIIFSLMLFLGASLYIRFVGKTR